VNTAQAYRWLAEERAARPVSLAPTLFLFGRLSSWRTLAGAARNDFEPVVGERHPTLREVAGTLREHGASIALMSGSGSTVFGVFDERPDAPELERATGCRVLLTRTAERVVPVERPA